VEAHKFSIRASLQLAQLPLFFRRPQTKPKKERKEILSSNCSSHFFPFPQLCAFSLSFCKEEMGAQLISPGGNSLIPAAVSNSAAKVRPGERERVIP